jgi:hypothetical protein
MHGAVKTPIIGVILQDENVARGFFKNDTQSGSFLLEAQP